METLILGIAFLILVVYLWKKEKNVLVQKDLLGNLDITDKFLPYL